MDQQRSSVRIEQLRARMREIGISAFLVPRTDEHQLQYIPPGAARLEWISGFSGSAGVAVVGLERAALFVDGRYTIQAAQQSPRWEQEHLVRGPPEKWLTTWLQAGDRVGFDPRLHTPEWLRTFAEALAATGAAVEPVSVNPIDALWTDRPAPPESPVEVYPQEYAGESSSSKLDTVRAALRRERLGALVVSAPDNLAWLFNIRGRDVAHTPLALGFAIVREQGGAAIFMNPVRIGGAVRGALDADVAPPEAFGAALDALAGLRVRVDVTSASVWIVERLRAAGVVVEVAVDPCSLLKACKNEREMAGIRAAHLRDGVALVRFMYWFARNAPGDLDEWSVARRVDEFRAEGELYRGQSFGTISAFGPNSALAHYSVSERSALPLQDNGIFLVDSGVQYLDGTTDVTRTFVIGEPTAEMRRRYTQVLKGHIALARARFPEGTTGGQLDALARQFLWQDGVDYDHGTGHGVGCYLGVHEGPQGISKAPNRAGLRPGMVVSDEPGYYKAGAFGIRIENLIVVTPCDPQPEGAEHRSCGFETLTLAPYERRLIEVPMLTGSEREWVDAYHARVRALLLPLLEADVAAFLEAASAPLA